MAKWVSAAEAVYAIKPGASVILPPGCGEATAVTAALLQDSERLKGTRLYSGLLLGEYPFLSDPHRARFSYGTWHVMGPVRKFIDDGAVDFYPLRASRVTSFMRRKGIDVAVVQVSPPDENGYCSLGVSTSYTFPLAQCAGLVVAEVNEQMPRTRGPCQIAESSITYAVRCDYPLIEYRSAVPDEISMKIAAHIEPLIPDNAVLQIGIGGVPEAILLALNASKRRGLRLYGMGIDSAVDLFEAGVLADDGPSMIAAELMGTRRLFDWVDGNERCQMCDFRALFDFASAPSPLISVNSALEVDLWGNANSEVMDNHQISGIGGSLDFMDLATRIAGGKCILALSATAKKGTVSKVVPRLDKVPQTIQRSAVHYIATEYGAVDLSLLSLDQRAEAMIRIAAPPFRDQLWNDYRALRSH
jgi:4-hydroxybutyrate CoA-transferase